MLRITLSALESAPGVALADVARLKLAEPENSFIRRTGLRPMAASREPSMPIEPGEHEVSAAVVVTFALELTRQ